MKATKFYKNQFRSEFTYADAAKYVDARTVRSVNLLTPEDRAQENWQRLRYEDAKRRAEAMERRDRQLSIQDAIVSFVIVASMFAASIIVLTHYSH